MSAFAQLVPPTRQEWKIKKKKRRCYAFIQQYKTYLNKILEKRPSDLKTDWIVNEIENTQTKYFGGRIYNLIDKYGFRIKTLQRIIHTLKWTQNKKYLISNIWERPYDFINREYQLISFEKVETINEHEGLGVSLSQRTQAWIYHVFLRGGRWSDPRTGKTIKGYTTDPAFFLPYKTIKDQWWWYIQYCNHPLTKEDQAIIKIERNRILDLFLIKKNNMYTTEEFVRLEKTLGETLLNLYYDAPDANILSTDIDSFIQDYEARENLELTKDQKQAVHLGITKKFSIITGYPGSGKSTIVKAIIQFKKTNTFCLTAPTGLAVKNLMEKCGKVSVIGTNHKLHYIMFPKIREQETLWVDHIIIDESSMIDFFMFKKLIEWCDYFQCSLTLVGDFHQLPPIGYGNPFTQIISSEIFTDNTTELLEIKRNSGVLSQNIIKLNRGQLRINDFDDNKMIFIEDPYLKNIKNHLQIISERDGKVQIIAAQKKNKGGVRELNREGQAIYNPDGKILTSGIEKYKIGDKIIRTENDYSNPDKMRVNGDMAIIVGNDGHEKVCIQYTDDNEIVTLFWEDFWDNFMHFYASTIHKVQGSQYKKIVVIIPQGHWWMWKQSGARALLYTALSRAQEKCIVIGSEQLFRCAQRKTTHHADSIFMKEFNTWEF